MDSYLVFLRSRFRLHAVVLRGIPLFLAIILADFSLSAWQLPEDRSPTTNSIPWLGLAGVPGGIPERTRVFVNVLTTKNPLYQATADGVSDCTSAISNAIYACPPEEVIYLPAGKYRINGRLAFSWKGNFSLRGDGSRTELLAFGGNNGVLEFGSSDYPRPTEGVPIQSGAVKGSTRIVVPGTTGFAVGKLVRVEQSDPDFVFVANGKPGGALMSTMHRVTAVSPTTVSFWPPLVLGLTNSPRAVPHKLGPVTGVGIENLKFNLTNSSCSSALYFLQTWGCWVKNVEIVGSNGRQIWWIRSSACETRDSFIHGLRSFGPNREGIDLYGDSCWNLVENNILDGIGVTIGDWMGGCSGNVVAFNYILNMNSGSDVAGGSINFNHAPHNVMNLAEGNVGQMGRSDGYYGSSSHGTMFRNHFSGQYPPGIKLQRAVSLERWSYWFSIAACVLGVEGAGQVYSSDISGESRPLIYRFGYPNMGNSGFSAINPPSNDVQALDRKVESTALLVANFDYATGSTVNPEPDLPQSLYLSEKPAWWGAHPWPPIGSDLTPMVGKIPAQVRYDFNKDRPPAPQDLKVRNPAPD